VYYGSQRSAAIDISASSSDVEDILSELIVSTIDDSNHRVEVSRFDHYDKANGVAWTVTFPDYQEVEALVVDDSFVTGDDAGVSVYDMLNFTSTAATNSISGHFRLRIGTSYTEYLSYQATEAKILYELEKLREVGHVSFLGTRTGVTYDTHTLSDVIVNDDVVYIDGDYTTVFSIHDPITINELSHVTTISAISYNSTSGYTDVTMTRSTSVYHSNATVLIGELVGSRTPLSGRVSLSSNDVYILHSYPNTENMSSIVYLTEGSVNITQLTVGDTIIIEGTNYEVRDINYNNCGQDCVNLTTSFVGTSVSSMDPMVPVFLSTMKLYFTDMKVHDELSVGDDL
jgi:hypothetical protein